MMHFFKSVCLIAIAAMAININVNAQDLEDKNDSLMSLALAGDVQAQLKLGYDYYYAYSSEDYEPNYPEAVKWFTLAAEQGNAEAQNYLGRCYQYGYGVDKDYKKAMQWYTRAAEQGESQAQSALAIMYVIKKDYNKALEWYNKGAYANLSMPEMLYESVGDIYNGNDKDYLRPLQDAAKKGHPEACATMACLYAMGHDVKQDDKKAVKMLQECLKRQGLPYNDVTIADVYYEIYEGKYRNYIINPILDYDTRPWLEKAANLGLAKAQYDLGEEYYRSIDYEQAVQWFERAAKQGHVQAQNDLGYCHLYGKGGDTDYNKAFEWISKAAEQDNKYATYNMGVCYKNGWAVEQDYEKAAYWFGKSADKDYAPAFPQLGYLYANGLGVAQDYEQAFQWYKKGANRQDLNSIYKVGEFYEHGLGVDQDFAQAAQYYTVAARQLSEAKEKLPYVYAMAKDYDNAVKWYKLNNEFDEDEDIDTGDMLFVIATRIYPDKNYLPLLQEAANMENNDALRTLACLYAIGGDVTRDEAKAVELYRKYSEDKDDNIADVYYNIYNNWSDIVIGQYEGLRFQWLEKAAQLGHEYAQYQLGNYYQEYEDDYNNAIVWWKKAAEQGHTIATREIAKCYDSGNGVAKNHNTAIQWFRKAADAGDSYSRNYLGECYLTGNGVPRNAKKAVSYFEQADYHDRAQYNLGLCYYYGKGVKQDYMTAAEWLAQSIDVNLYPPAIYDDEDEAQELDVEVDDRVVDIVKTNEEVLENKEIVGAQDVRTDNNIYLQTAQNDPWELYYTGCNEIKNGNIQEAIQWLEKAVQQDYEPAMEMLAFIYAIGADGVPRNDDMAVTYYTNYLKGTDNEPKQNVTIADVYYGIYNDWSDATSSLYDGGRGQWLEKAAQLGLAKAQYNLADNYYNGYYGFDEDEEKAAQWYRKAAEQGLAEAQIDLADCYCEGTGVDRDLKQAFDWLSRAAGQGDPKAQYMLGHFYLEGATVKKSTTQANQLFRQSATTFKTRADEYYKQE